MSSKEPGASVSDSDRDAILTAVAAEHFAMQGVVSTSVNEQQARASMFLFSVSGALVALGILAQSDKFLLFTAAIIPALYLMGLLTTLRLVDVGIESLQSLVTVAKIRKYYRSLGEPAGSLFEEQLGRWPEGELDSGHVIGKILGVLTTAASMIACVNGFIGGAGIAILLYQVARTSLTVSCLVGVLFAIGQIMIVYVYQSWRFKMIARLAEERELFARSG
jgi:hypothetical protein